jgi:uncharacterized membrane protein YcaP (DUF421 family)
MLQDVDLESVLRVLITAAAAYLVLIVVLRLTGKRTLSKWNSFDFIVTIALGSVLATVILAKDVPLLEGILALAALVGLQLVLTWSAVRLGWLDRLIKARPALLLHRGELCLETMRRERVSEPEIYAALRSHGVTDLEEVEAVVLETDGTFSVLERRPGAPLTTLRDVVGHPAQQRDTRQAETQARPQDGAPGGGEAQA